ncbi:MAG: hypothetical protein J2P21_01500 [Chloracidobacterium sp.]|nr:hypothetical protein [Chloracidobacterium sp.]
MTDVKAEKQRDDLRRASQGNRQSESTVRRADGPGRCSGSEFLSFFTLNPGDYFGPSFDKCRWIRASSTAL